MIITTFDSGAILLYTELGVVTLNASGGLNFVAKMKKDNNRKATSHIAVMSIVVLLRGIFALGIVNFFVVGPIFYYQNKIRKFANSTIGVTDLTLFIPHRAPGNRGLPSCAYLYREAKLWVRVNPHSSIP